MVIDTSALVAILELEPEARAFAGAIAAAEVRLISAASAVELGIVLVARRGVAGGELVDALLRELDIEIAPVTAGQVRLAREAFTHFGRGRHPACLNFGDCFSYALARATGNPLLFKGADFAATDLAAVQV